MLFRQGCSCHCSALYTIYCNWRRFQSALGLLEWDLLLLLLVEQPRLLPMFQEPDTRRTQRIVTTFSVRRRRVEEWILEQSLSNLESLRHILLGKGRTPRYVWRTPIPASCTHQTGVALLADEKGHSIFIFVRRTGI